MRLWVMMMMAALWLACGEADVEGPGPAMPTAGGVPGLVGVPAVPGATPPTGAPPANGMGQTPTGVIPPAGAGNCVPDATTFMTTVQPILEDRCLGCHGEPTNFGAPLSLTSYDNMVAGGAPTRVVDRMLRELTAGSMPPAGNIKPTIAEFETLTSWASCGMAAPSYPSGLTASRPVLQSPPNPPATAEPIYLTTGNATVEAGSIDVYRNFRLTGRIPRNTYVRRFSSTIDNARIVHHITLHYATDSDKYLYTWAPGTNDVEFPDGGLPVAPTDEFRLEVHYNNPGNTDETDDSGIILWVEDSAEKEYAMLDPATFNINVGPRAMGSASVECVADNDFTIYGGMPHMHEIGSAFTHTVTRAANGQPETLIELSGWSFDEQYFYAFPMEIRAGDRMNIRCDYRNDKERPVTAGLGTTDEMCFNFIYVTPRNGSLSCPGGFGKGLVP